MRKNWTKKEKYSQDQKSDTWHRFDWKSNFHRKIISKRNVIIVKSSRWIEDNSKKKFIANIAVKYRECGHWTSSVSTLTLPLPPGRDLCQRLNIVMILFICIYTHLFR